MTSPTSSAKPPIATRMKMLRRKLRDDATEPRYLHTVRGVGFRFASDDAE